MDEKTLAKIAEGVAAGLGGRKLRLKDARRLIHKVEEKASEIGVNAVCAVANDGANIIAVECMDGSYIASYDIAVNKAFTCAALKMPTSKLKELACPGGSLYGIQFTNGGRIVIFGGGVLLFSGGRLVGSLGVSGGSEEQDTLLAQYGKKVFEEEILP